MTLSPKDISILIKAVKDADLAAQRKLYEYCYVHCFKVAMIYCGDQEEAMSVFNHSMLDVFQQLDKLRKTERLTHWVSSIVRRDCIDHLRKQVAYRNRLIVVDKIENDASVDNDAISNLAMAEIIALVNSLKPTHRLCFVMRALEGYTYDEISNKLKININTAKWYYSEARKLLRGTIEEQYHFTQNSRK